MCAVLSFVLVLMSIVSGVVLSVVLLVDVVFAEVWVVVCGVPVNVSCVSGCNV